MIYGVPDWLWITLLSLAAFGVLLAVVWWDDRRDDTGSHRARHRAGAARDADTIALFDAMRAEDTSGLTLHHEGDPAPVSLVRHADIALWPGTVPAAALPPDEQAWPRRGKPAEGVIVAGPPGHARAGTTVLPPPVALHALPALIEHARTTLYLAERPELAHGAGFSDATGEFTLRWTEPAPDPAGPGPLSAPPEWHGEMASEAT